MLRLHPHRRWGFFWYSHWQSVSVKCAFKVFWHSTSVSEVLTQRAAWVHPKSLANFEHSICVICQCHDYTWWEVLHTYNTPSRLPACCSLLIWSLFQNVFTVTSSVSPSLKTWRLAGSLYCLCFCCLLKVFFLVCHVTLTRKSADENFYTRDLAPRYCWDFLQYNSYRFPD